MALKVFAGLTFVGGKQVNTVVATTSQLKAAQLVGTTVGDIRTYWAITGNAQQIGAAMSQPGVVFKSSALGKHDYQPVMGGE